MSIKRLSGYLADINAGKPINYPAFLALLKTLNLSYPVKASDLVASKCSGNMYLVEFKSHEIENRLTKISLIDTTNRAGLSNLNRSHDTCVSGSLITARQIGGHPFVIMVDSIGEYISPVPLNKKCVVIENLQNFLELPITIEFLASHGLIQNEQSTDFIYASGTSITNKLNSQFFEQYDDIRLFLDFDLGGLKIAKTMLDRYGSETIHYLVPGDIEGRLEEIDTVVKPEYLRKVEKVGLSCSHLARFAKIIRHHRKILEQENYLNG